MALYLAEGIEAGRLDYVAVVAKWSQFKEEIDRMLVADGRQDLIVE